MKIGVRRLEAQRDRRSNHSPLPTRRRSLRRLFPTS